MNVAISPKIGNICCCLNGVNTVPFRDHQNRKVALFTELVLRNNRQIFPRSLPKLFLFLSRFVAVSEEV